MRIDVEITITESGYRRDADTVRREISVNLPDRFIGLVNFSEVCGEIVADAISDYTSRTPQPALVSDNNHDA